MAFPAIAGQGAGEVPRSFGPREMTKESKSFLRQPGSLLASLRRARRAEAGGTPWGDAVPYRRVKHLPRWGDLTHCNTSSWQRAGDLAEHFSRKDTALR